MPPAEAEPQPGALPAVKEDYPGGTDDHDGASASPTEGTEAEDGASAEDAAAYPSTREAGKAEPASVCGMIRDVWALLLCQGLDAILGICWATIIRR